MSKTVGRMEERVDKKEGVKFFNLEISFRFRLRWNFT